MAYHLGKLITRPKPPKPSTFLWEAPRLCIAGSAASGVRGGETIEPALGILLSSIGPSRHSGITASPSDCCMAMNVK